MLAHINSWQANMNREMRRASEREGQRRQKQPWNAFQDVTRESFSRARLLRGENAWVPDQVWANNKYIVQLLKDNKVYLDHRWDKIMVRRCDSQPIFSWQDMQRIKNEIFGEETEAIQFLPKQSKLVDEANLYWFFISRGKA